MKMYVLVVLCCILFTDKAISQNFNFKFSNKDSSILITECDSILKIYLIKNIDSSFLEKTGKNMWFNGDSVFCKPYKLSTFPFECIYSGNPEFFRKKLLLILFNLETDNSDTTYIDLKINLLLYELYNRNACKLNDYLISSDYNGWRMMMKESDLKYWKKHFKG